MDLLVFTKELKLCPKIEWISMKVLRKKISKGKQSSTKQYRYLTLHDSETDNNKNLRHMISLISQRMNIFVMHQIAKIGHAVITKEGEQTVALNMSFLQPMMKKHLQFVLWWILKRLSHSVGCIDLERKHPMAIRRCMQNVLFMEK